jgi:hypothetical protein
LHGRLDRPPNPAQNHIATALAWEVISAAE